MGSATRALRVLAASALVAGLCVPAAAAADPVAAKITITVPAAPIVCRVETEISALVLDAGGATIAGKTVTWELMPFASSQDNWRPITSDTGSQGVATTKVWIDCIPGLRTLHAKADGVDQTVDLTISGVGMPTATPKPTAPSTSAVGASDGSNGRAGGGFLFAAALAAAGLMGLVVAGRRRAARA
jgi:hypothetical protein